MTPTQFRAIASSLPETVEGSHMGHADFRVRGKVFATLGYPDDEWGMVNLTVDEQTVYVSAEPAAFKPAAGAWGKRGNTLVRLTVIDATTVRGALTAAWQGVPSAKPRAKKR